MLEYRNNWYNHEYSCNGERVAPSKVHVGGVGTFDVTKKEESGYYDDHGHNYSYSTQQYFVVIDSPFGNVRGPSLQELIEKGYVIQVLK